MFLKSLKNTIITLAKNAVLTVEEEMGSGNGQIKKQKAIEYIVSNLPFSGIVKSIITSFLSRFIDNAIETAVEYLHSLPRKQGD